MKEIYRPVLAAILARTNMGLDEPEPSEVVGLASAKVSRSDAVNSLCGSFCEGESMLEMFEEEAKGFEEMFSGKTDERIRASWPHRAALIDAVTIEV